MQIASKKDKTRKAYTANVAEFDMAMEVLDSASLA